MDWRNFLKEFEGKKKDFLKRIKEIAVSVQKSDERKWLEFDKLSAVFDFVVC